MTGLWSREDVLNSSPSPTPPAGGYLQMHSSPRAPGPSPIDSASVSPEGPQANSPWRTNPHSQNSKTSQFIDKLQAENDRLRRDLRAEKLAREEDLRRLGAAKAKAEDSRTEYQHLQVLADTNARALERKDRKVDDLKASLDAETQRRIAAEQREAEMSRILDETKSETQRELAKAISLQQQAETHADAAREGFKRIQDGYERKIRQMAKELDDLKRQQVEDAHKIRKQAIVSEQLAQECARISKAEDSMRDLLATYKKEHEKGLDGLVSEAERLRLAVPAKEAAAEQLCDKLKETSDKMNWVMSLQKTKDS
ncbi:hypothetical protein K432DRAFT_377938 [Lepidopterella palustris CBS 459.81]|uniref:SWI5-dependent HO expression protein 3 n=1 Tax=Lepidopterella palustris CBS 459.81 TaxID=1314670 RepID=A0A8E2JK90_9PEZI|nr:hypothetical protein K432DRAFT_377938 [Lepidopterella palustris CBS 459.81]